MKTKNTLARVVAVLGILAFGLLSYGDAASLTSRVDLTITANLTNPLDLTTASAPLTVRRFQDFTNGTGSGQANVIWSDQRVLTTGATEDLDFAGGGLVDAFGVAVAPARVKAVIIASAAANTTNLTLFGDVNSILLLNTAATTVTLKPGGIYVFTDPSTTGVVVTAGTGDIIQVVNGAGASATYDVIVIGTSS